MHVTFFLHPRYVYLPSQAQTAPAGWILNFLQFALISCYPNCNFVLYPISLSFQLSLSTVSAGLTFVHISLTTQASFVPTSRTITQAKFRIFHVLDTLPLSTRIFSPSCIIWCLLCLSMHPHNVHDLLLSLHFCTKD